MNYVAKQYNYNAYSYRLKSDSNESVSNRNSITVVV